MIKITIEGPPHAGKTRLADWLYDHLPVRELSIDGIVDEMHGKNRTRELLLDKIEIVIKQTQ